MLYKMSLKLSASTALLEACDWDEDRANFVADKAVETLTNMHSYSKEDRSGNLTSVFRQLMIQHASPEQIDIIETMLKDELTWESIDESTGEHDEN